MKSIYKRIISSILIIILVLSLPVSYIGTATVKAEEKNLEIYNENGIMITFKVTSQWEKAFEGQFILSNQSNAPLENWKMEMEFKHKITSIWDGEIEQNEGNRYIIKCPSWNIKIPSGGKAVIGFIAEASGNINTPTNCKLLNAKSEVKNEDYTINFRVTSDWGDAFNAEISILNNTNKKIEGWKLEFDFDKSIKTLWNAKLLEKKGNHYILGNDEWNSVIQPNSKISFGFEGNPGNIKSQPTNYKLIAFDGTGDKGEEIENIKLDRTTDTDGDGLPDWIEKGVAQTDMNKVDTDGDGLSDYYEYIVLHTDPNLKDTDGNGITDDKEDLDKDGLTNLEEFKLGTDPLLADTDEDGLTDGDEVLKYKTDPLKEDSDGDGISDFDEVYLKLDPNKTHTHDGMKDSNYKIWQESATEQLKELNAQNDYEISLRLNASGNTKDIPAQTGYELALSNNRAIIGSPVNFLYDDNKISEGEIQYKLKSSLLKEQIPLLSDKKIGLKRYSIFKLDEKNNILSPIPVTYDKKNNIIKAKFKELGAFCLVDLECLVYDLGLEKDTDTNENKVKKTEPSITAEELAQILNSTPVKSAKKSKGVKRQIDLVLAIDSTGSMTNYINAIKENIIYLIKELKKENISLYVSIIDYKDIVYDGEDSTKVNSPKKVDFLNNPNDIIQVLDAIKIGGGGGDGPETTLDALGAAINLKYRKSAEKFAFVITSSGYKNDNSYNIANMNAMIKILKEKGIKTSVITEYNKMDKYKKLCDSTKGQWINLLGEFNKDIYQMLVQKSKGSYYGITATDLSVITLNKKPTKNGKTDTDGDGLSDSKEINWKWITETDNKLELPTLKKLIKSNYNIEASSLKNILYMDKILKVKVIPLLSNPAEKDSDGDCYSDKDDKQPFYSNEMWILDEQIDDDNIFNTTQKSNLAKKEVTIDNPQSVDIIDSDIIYDSPNLSKKPSAKYNRRVSDNSYKKTFQFIIKPKRNSDYKFTISKFDSVKKQNIKVEKRKKNLFSTKYETVKAYKKAKKNKNGSKTYYYSLKQDKTYVITVNCSSSAKYYQSYSFIATQDNWVKVGKHGGVWENTSKKTGVSYFYPLKQYFIDKDTATYVNAIKYQKDVRSDLNSALVTTGQLTISGAVAIVQKWAEKNASKKLAKSVLKAVPFVGWVSNAITIYYLSNTFLGIAEAKDFFDAYNNGKGIIYATCIMSNVGTMSLWEPWKKESVNYVNKYVTGYKGEITKGFTKKNCEELFKS